MAAFGSASTPPASIAAWLSSEGTVGSLPGGSTGSLPGALPSACATGSVGSL